VDEIERCGANLGDVWGWGEIRKAAGTESSGLVRGMRGGLHLLKNVKIRVPLLNCSRGRVMFIHVLFLNYQCSLTAPGTSLTQTNQTQ